MSTHLSIKKSNTNRTLSLKHIPLPQYNPYLIFTHDIVRDTKTLYFEIKTSQPPSPDKEYLRIMRGYTGIMSSSDSSTSDLHGNGERVKFENKHCLWTPKSGEPKEEPKWHLRVSVLKDQEGRGDAPSRRFAFRSLHHLTHAANQLDAAFRDSFEIKKCGVELPDAMGGRVNDGRSENITIEFESDTATQPWKEFLAKLKALEDEWEHESHNDALSVL